MTATALIRFADARAALGVATNRTLKAACTRHNVPIVEISSRVKALTPQGYALLLERASIKETV
jgi:hypothetical protein